jgi:hypothetical protein
MKTKKNPNKIVSTILFALFVSPTIAADRFAPPKIGAPLNNFEERFRADQLNVSFILARVLNEARLIRREGDNFRRTATIFRSGTDNSAVSNSVIIPPGTNADTIIVINQNDGDSYAIQR